MPQQIAPTRPPLSRSRKILFASVAVLLAILFLELALAIAGVKPLLFARDPYVGFSSTSRQFVEEIGTDGATYLATAKDRLEFFNPQRFPKQKAPGTFRIFSLGGSTTYGHPYSDPTSFNGWLREFLKATAPERNWEAINVGGISYGSARVAKLMEELVQYQPDLFLIYCGQNEFLEKRIYGKITQQPPILRELSTLARRTRIGTALDSVLRAAQRRSPATNQTALLPDLPQTLLDNALGPKAYRRADLKRDEVFAHYRYNLERMIEIARAANARVILVAPATNLRDCSPFKSEFAATVSAADQARCRELLKQARDDYFQSAAPTNGLKLANAALEIDERWAETHFVRGRLLEKLGRFEEAKTAFEKARDEDVCPLRAPSEINRIVREVCAANQVPLVEYDKLIERLSDHTIPGAKWFLDHVHLTIDGYRLLGLELLKTIEREKFAPVAVRPEAIEKATKLVQSRVDNRANSFALMNLCKTLGWAGKREEAFHAGAQAAQIAPDDPRVQYEAGLAAQMLNRSAEAIAYYSKAVELQPNHAEAHCGLGFVYEKNGDWQNAATHYRLALQHGKPENRIRDNYNLTNALAKLAR